MANFYTHLTISSGIGIVGITILCGAGLVTANESLALIALCVFGGLLPDLDSDSESSINIISKLFSGSAAFIIMFPFIHNFAILISLGLFVLSYLVFRFGIFNIIHYLTKHRGLIHSVPSAGIFCLLTSIVLFNVFHTNLNFAWFGASFGLIGYLSHLVLDESLSENLSGEPMPRPRGSVFQFFGFKNKQWIVFSILYIGLISIYFFTPSFNPFSQYLFSKKTALHIEHRMLSGSLPIDMQYLSEDSSYGDYKDGDIINV